MRAVTDAVLTVPPITDKVCGDGSAASPLGVAFTGTGSANTVARSDHQHDDSYLRLGSKPDQLAGPAKMYSRLMTPRWLEANASIHSARSVNVTDSSIRFGPAGAGNDSTRLFTVPLIPAGSLNTNEGYIVRIVVGQAVPTPDNDPLFGVSDGTTFVGFQKMDSDNTVEGLGLAVIGTDGNNLVVNASQNLGGPASNLGAFEVLLRLEPAGAGAVYLIGRAGTAVVHFHATTNLDRTAGLFFATYAGHAAEVYTFHSFEVSVEREG